MDKDDMFLGIVGIIIAGAMGYVVVKDYDKSRETVPCPKCFRPVPVEAPICPWCRSRLLWC